MADRKKGSGVTPEQKAKLDAVAARIRAVGDAERVVAFVDRKAEAEAQMTYVVLQVKEAIANSGLTGYALAQRTGLSQSAISKFLSGSRLNLTIDTLARLCAELGLVLRLEPKPTRTARR
jgi:DNA-binding Xre family transcriptional regulator